MIARQTAAPTTGVHRHPTTHGTSPTPTSTATTATTAATAAADAIAAAIAIRRRLGASTGHRRRLIRRGIAFDAAAGRTPVAGNADAD